MVILLQFKNASAPIIVSSPAMINSFSIVQFWKALLPMLAMLAGIATLVICVLPQNAFGAIADTGTPS